VEGVQAGRPGTQSVLDRLAASGLGPEQALAHVQRQVDQQAFTMAVTDVFLLSSTLFIGLIGLVWLTRPRPPAARAAAPVAVAD
ncbi:MAG: multidrug resistance protein, partial [Pseudomonadota bacterium]